MSENPSLPAPQDRPDPTPQLRNLMYEMREAVKRCCAPGVPEARWGYVSDFNVLEWATRLEKLLGEVAAPARAHQEETTDEKDVVSRVDGVPGVGQGDLPRKPPTGEQ